MTAQHAPFRYSHRVIKSLNLGLQGETSGLQSIYQKKGLEKKGNHPGHI
jgi:hypothetical protein